MGVQANFGVKTQYDDGLKPLLEHLKQIPALAKSLEQIFKTTFDAGSAAAKKFATDSQSASQQSQDRITELTLRALERREAAELAAIEKRRQKENESKGRTIAQLEEELKLHERSNKELLSFQHHLEEEQTAIARRITMTLDGEEKKRLKNTQAELKSELASVKQAAEERGIAESKGHGGGHGAGAIGGAVAGAEIAVQGLETVLEKSKEVTESQHQLQVGTGLAGDALKRAGEDALILGDKLGVSGNEAKSTMGKVSSYTHATGEELKQQTEAVIAYAQAHGKSAEMVAKKLSTEAGRNEIFAESITNVGKAQDAANEPAIRAQLAQQKLEETAGELANTLLQGLAPILTQLSPLIGEVGEVAGDILSPAMKLVSIVLTPLLEGLHALKPILPELVVAVGILTVAFNAQAIATGILNAVMAVNPFVWIGLAVVALIGGIVLLVKHWQEVITWFKEAAKTVMNAGGALLSLLGITTNASAATKKHTDAIKDHTKAVKESKVSVDDYVASLRKETEERNKSAKQAADDSILVLQEIEKKLASGTLSPEERKVWEERRAQWTNYGKQAVHAYETEEEAAHKASKEIGASADNDPKVKKEKTKLKTLAELNHTAAESAKKAETDRFNDELADLELSETNKFISKEEFEKQAAVARETHDAELLRIDAQYHVDSGKDELAAATNRRAEQDKADKLEADAKKKFYAVEKSIEKNAMDAAIDAEKEGLQKSLDIEGQKLHDEIGILRDQLEQKEITQDQFDRLRKQKIQKSLAEQGKLTADAAQKDIDTQRQQIEFFMGPFLNGFHKGFESLNKMTQEWTSHWFDTKTVFGQVMDEIASGFISMIEQMIEKIIAMEAILLVANLIPGFSAFAKSLDVIGDLIPGHEDGTESSPGGWHMVGERGVELVNMTPGAQVVPNHRLPSVGNSVDLSPMVSHLESIERGLSRANDTFARRPAPVMPVGDRFRTLVIQSENAEALRSR